MPQSKNLFGENPKVSFFLGLFVGVAVFSTITSLVLVVAMVSGNGLSFAKSDKADNNAVVADDTVAAADNGEEVAAEVPAITSSDNVWGPSDADVTMVIYSDFECPYCLRYSATLSQIMDEYEDDVRIVFRHFPLSFHANAKGAALASECAAEQGKFWEMHDKIFEANAADNMSLDTWKDDAKELGLDTEEFNDCLDSEKYADEIALQMQGGAQAGVRGTPATFINGQLVSGALPFESFQQIIDAELAK